MFSDPYLQQSSDNLVPRMHDDDTHNLSPKHYNEERIDNGYHQVIMFETLYTLRSYDVIQTSPSVVYIVQV